jgi:hypothetical protein
VSVLPTVILTCADQSHSNVPGNYDETHPQIEVDFDGAKLLLDTMFDALGWILSITAKPKKLTKEVTETNFFIPLLGLYGKWSQTLVIKKKLETTIKKKTNEETTALKENKEDFPAMLHLSYWQDVKSKKLYTLLGSTPGKATATTLSEEQLKEKAKKETVDSKASGKKQETKDPVPVLDNPLVSPRSRMIDQRQKRLLKLGYEAVGVRGPGKLKGHQNDLVDPVTGTEGEIGFGRCAETYFYIWAGYWM